MKNRCVEGCSDSGPSQQVLDRQVQVVQHLELGHVRNGKRSECGGEKQEPAAGRVSSWCLVHEQREAELQRPSMAAEADHGRPESSASEPGGSQDPEGQGERVSTATHCIAVARCLTGHAPTVEVRLQEPAQRVQRQTRADDEVPQGIAAGDVSMLV